MLRAVVLLFLIILFSGCGQKAIYSHSVDIPGKSWHAEDTIDFRWNVEDTSAVYDLVLGVEHLDNIPSQNIYVKAISTNPAGLANEQLVSLELLKNSGEPYGQCGFGPCKIDMVLASGVYFPARGIYHLSLIPWSRINPVDGVESISLTIEPARKKEKN